MWEALAIIAMSVFGATAIVGMIVWNGHRHMTKTKTYSRASWHGTPVRRPPVRGLQAPLPPTHPLASGLWQTHTVQSTHHVKTPVYKEDVDLESAVSAIEKMATELGLSPEEIRAVTQSLEGQVDGMPEKPPEENDVCPECGSLFALAEDYLCPGCRSKR